MARIDVDFHHVAVESEIRNGLNAPLVRRRAGRERTERHKRDRESRGHVNGFHRVPPLSSSTLAQDDGNVTNAGHLPGAVPRQTEVENGDHLGRTSTALALLAGCSSTVAPGGTTPTGASSGAPTGTTVSASVSQSPQQICDGSFGSDATLDWAPGTVADFRAHSYGGPRRCAAGHRRSAEVGDGSLVPNPAWRRSRNCRRRSAEATETLMPKRSSRSGRWDDAGSRRPSSADACCCTPPTGRGRWECNPGDLPSPPPFVRNGKVARIRDVSVVLCQS